jgi:BirA family biotin operon repressor/biotin-[acetyl-CoA-carboxylase] ligase
MGKKVVYMPSCSSTNEVASDLMRIQEIEEGTVVITDHQTSGRGQQGNQWESTKGMNITCSLILKPKVLALRDQFVLNMIVSLGVADLVSEVLSVEAKVKWPNDVYCNGEKISGILINSTIKGYMLEHAVVGIGLNVNQQIFANVNATSLSLHSGNTIYSLPQILESLILCVEKRYFQWKNDVEALRSDYLGKMYWYDQVRTYKENGKYFTGIIKGVTTAGKLLVEDEKQTRSFDFKAIAFVK